MEIATTKPMCFSQGFVAHDMDSKKESASRKAIYVSA